MNLGQVVVLHGVGTHDVVRSTVSCQRVVQHLVAQRSAQEEAEVPVLPCEVVGPSELSLRQCVADIGTVVIRNDTVMINILIDEVAVCIQTQALQVEEVTQ